MFRFVSFSCALPLLLLFSCQQTEQAKAKAEKPNILFIMADDHAFQAISAYKHPLSKLAPTPNIDRIAADGAIFQNSFCTNSICGPSRAVILTGKHSHLNGFRMNGETFNGDQPTLPKHLQKLGYKTAIVGKWHLHGYPQGFDYIKIINDQGNYYNPDFLLPPDSTGKSETERISGYATDLITDFSLGWLDQQNEASPFFMMVYHKAPHRNWMPAPRHLNLYDSVEFPLPESYFANHEGSVASKQQQQTIYKDMYEGHDLKMTKRKGDPELDHNPWTTDFERMSAEQRSFWDSSYQAKNDALHDANLTGKALAEWKGQRYLQEYLATVAAVDEGVGKILDKLEEKGLKENTLVVYTSDQGFYLGEKGWFDKRFMYEESLRMPLLMQYPKGIKKGTEVQALIQNLDFAQTFLDYAGGSEYTEGMQGKSFKKLVESKDESTFRDYVYYHYYDFPAFHMVKRHYGIRGQRFKLMHFYDDLDEWEFYDLENDPTEINNLINDPAYQDTIRTLRSKLKTLQAEYKVTDKEFEKTDPKKAEKAYKNFEKLRGIPKL